MMVDTFLCLPSLYHFIFFQKNPVFCSFSVLSYEKGMMCNAYAPREKTIAGTTEKAGFYADFFFKRLSAFAARRVPTV